MKELKVICALPYSKVRECCHAIKGAWSLNDSAVRRCASRIASGLGDCILVPAPSHTGPATDALVLAQAICSEMVSRGHVCVVCDVLAAVPHRSLCEAKHNGEDPSTIKIMVYRKDNADNGFLVTNESLSPAYRLPVRLVDNVIDTGRTARACMKVLPFDAVVAVGDTGEWKKETTETTQS